MVIPIKKFFASALLRNFLSLSIVKGLDYIVPILLIPFLFRTLEVEKFGLLYFAQAFINYFVAFTAFGFNYYTTYYISVNISDKNKINTAFWSVILSKLLLCVISAIIMLAIVYNFKSFEEYKFVYIFYFGIVVGEALLPTWFFQAIEKMNFITYIAIATRMISIIPMFFLVKGPQDVYIPPLFYSIGSIIGSLIGISIAVKKFEIKICNIKIKNILEHIKGSSVFALANLCTSIQSQTGAFFLGLTCGTTATGIYAAGQKLVTAYISIIQPLQMVLYPYMAKNKNIKLFKKLFVGLTMFNTLNVSIFFALSGVLIYYFYNTTSLEIVNVTKILTIEAYATVPTILIGFPLLGILISNKEVIKTTIIGSVFYICSVLLMYCFGYVNIYTIAIFTVITEYFILIQRIYKLYINKKTNPILC